MKKLLPWTVAFLIGAWVIAKMIPPKEPPGFDIGGFGRLPVLVNGRVMPIDTLARLSLLAMNRHGTCITSDCKHVPQARWFGKDILAIEKKITDPSEIIKQNQGFEISRLLLNQPREQQQHPGIDR